MEQPEKTYREIIEEGDAQRELHRKQAAQEMNDPVFLREALELEYQDRKRLKRELVAANAEIARLQNQNNELTVSHVAIMGAMKRAYGVDIDCTVEQLAGAITSMEADLIVTRKAEAAYKAETERLRGELKRIAQTAQEATEKAKLETHPGATYRDGLSIMMHLALMALPIDQQP